MDDNVLYARIAELEILLNNQTIQIEKVKHLMVSLKQMNNGVVELKNQRNAAYERIDELEKRLKWYRGCGLGGEL